MAMDDKMAGLADAIQAMFAAAEKKDWEAAAQAFTDADSITDSENGEAEEKEEKAEPEKGGKRPLAAILIGGPSKK